MAQGTRRSDSTSAFLAGSATKHTVTKKSGVNFEHLATLSLASYHHCRRDPPPHSFNAPACSFETGNSRPPVFTARPLFRPITHRGRLTSQQQECTNPECRLLRPRTLTHVPCTDPEKKTLMKNSRILHAFREDPKQSLPKAPKERLVIYNYYRAKERKTCQTSRRVCPRLPDYCCCCCSCHRRVSLTLRTAGRS